MTVSQEALLPLTPAQLQWWAAEHLHQITSGCADATYTTAEVLAVRAPLDALALTTAVHRLAERHQVLSTAFLTVDGTPRQQTLGQAAVSVELYSLPASDHAEEQFRALLEPALRTPFELEGAPLWRVLAATAGPVTHLAIVLHHVVADGWSVDLLIRDLGALYHSATGDAAESAVPLGYHAWWQQHQGAEWAADRADAAEFWTRALADCPDPVVVPGLGAQARPVPGGAQSFTALPADVHGRVCDAAAKCGTTPYAVYLTGYVLALSRLTRERDVVVGVPSANRLDEASEQVVGPFATILPVRVRLPISAEPVALVEQVSAALFGAMEHERLPFAEIVACAGRQSSGTDLPLFRTVAMQRLWREEQTTFAGYPASRLWVSTGSAQHDLLVTFPTRDGDPRLVVQYDLHRYDQRLAEGVGRAVGTALAQLLTGQRIQVERPLPALAGSEPLHQRVADVAREAPDHPAVVEGRSWCSYGELEDQATRVARGLAALGVGAGDRVGLQLERGINFVVAALGVLTCGAAYVPTDSRWPAARLGEVLAVTCLTIGGSNDTPATGPAATTVQRLLSLGDSGPPVPLPRVGADHACCVLYTSGSTGTPKGAVIRHKSVQRLVAADQRHALRRTDRIAHQANLAFDGATYEIWAALVTGATIEVGRRDFDGPAEYARVLSICTAAFVPTGLFTELVEHPDCRAALRGLRLLTVGGGVLSPHAAARVDSAGIHLNVYGPTECTTFSVTGPMSARSPAGTVPIGTPIAGTHAYVLDAELQTVADGDVGELYLAGAGVAEGYVDDPALTAQRFVPDIGEPGQRMYATGDRVRRLPGGELDYLGRGDQQLKIRGFRVEPGEIEARLGEMAGVRAAYAGLDNTGQLAAAVLADDKTSPKTLLTGLRHTLPDFMVPRRIRVCASVPVTPNGKVDVRLLLSTQDAGGIVPVPASVDGGLVDRVALVWSAVLGVTVAPETNFFEAGGDSLRVLRLLAGCRKEFGVDLTPAGLYRHPVASSFAELLRKCMEAT